MAIHNLMEEEVLRVINEICDDEAQKEHPVFCVTPGCRQDAACFVLNRIPPGYVTSGRGLAYAETAYKGNPQLHVDLVTLASEGLKRVTSIRRSFYKGNEEEAPLPAGPCFNFPTITGRLFNGLTFEPLTDIDVELRSNGRLVEMVDARWSNPHHIVPNTPGRYLFWPASIPSSEVGIESEYEFEIRSEVSGFEPFYHFFRIRLCADSRPDVVIRFSQDHALPDLYLLPE